MKIWCIFKSDTAMKWRELLVVDEPSPLACVAHNILGESPGRNIMIPVFRNLCYIDAIFVSAIFLSIVSFAFRSDQNTLFCPRKGGSGYLKLTIYA